MPSVLLALAPLVTPALLQASQASTAPSNPLAAPVPAGQGSGTASRSVGTVIGFDSRLSWSAVTGATTLIDFESIASGTTISNHFAGVGVAFVSGESIFEVPPGPTDVRVESSQNLPFPMFTPGTLPTETNFLSNRLDPGVFASGFIAFDFTVPTMSVGAFIADASPLDGFSIEVFSASGVSIGSYQSPGRMLPDSFIGVTSPTAFSRAVFTTVSMFDSWGLDNVEFGNTALGVRYCSPNVPNSSSLSGEMSLAGSAIAADNSLTLTASNLPNNQFGIFLTSMAQDFVPGAGGASNGNLCLGGNVGRFTGTGQVLATGFNGEFSLAIDLTAIPQGNGTVAAMSGETWNFQAWHRDSVGVGSNLTDGISLTFI